MSEILKGVFAAAMSVLKADLSLDIEETLNHAKKNLDRQWSWLRIFWQHRLWTINFKK